MELIGKQKNYEMLRFSSEEIGYRKDKFASYFSDEGRNHEVHNSDLLCETKFFAVAAVARVGATLVCDLLTEFNFGKPYECFNLPIDTGSSNPIPWVNYLENIVSTGRSDSLYFGAKVGIFDLIPFLDGTYAWPAGFSSWKWVYITRGNVLDQAISLEIARQTNEWNSAHETGARINAEFNSNAIIDSINVIVNDMARWEIFFAVNNISPLRINYEKIEKFPLSTVGGIIEFVTGDEKSATDSFNTVRRQRDNLNKIWKNKILEEISCG